MNSAAETYAMKRYLIFVFPRWYPEGGMNDFDSEYDTKKEVVERIKLIDWNTLLQVFDCKERRIIYKAQTRGRYVSR